MRIEAFDINWDTDGEDIDLPTELVVDIDDDSSDIAGDACDELSNHTGFCVNSFDYKAYI